MSGIQIGDPEHGNLDYLQLRKDNIKIPKQFYLRKELSEKIYGLNAVGANDYHKATSQTAADQDVSASNPIKGGHPLVPKLNLPRQDPND